MFNCPMCEKAKSSYVSLVDFLMAAVRKFTVYDFAVFKTLLFSMGLLVGANLSQKIKKFEIVIIFISLASYVYIIYKIFKKE